jgi:hypothetical protein
MKRPLTSLEMIDDLKAKIADAEQLIGGYQKKIADIEAGRAKAQEQEARRKDRADFEAWQAAGRPMPTGVQK